MSGTAQEKTRIFFRRKNRPARKHRNTRTPLRDISKVISRKIMEYSSAHLHAHSGIFPQKKEPPGPRPSLSPEEHFPLEAFSECTQDGSRIIPAASRNSPGLLPEGSLCPFRQLSPIDFRMMPGRSSSKETGLISGFCREVPPFPRRKFPECSQDDLSVDSSRIAARIIHFPGVIFGSCGEAPLLYRMFPDCGGEEASTCR